MSGQLESANLSDAKRIAVEKFLPHMTRCTFAKGDVLFRKGDPASRMFYIEDGVVSLPEIGKTLGSGEFLGEMGVLCSFHERTVSAVCSEPVVARTMDTDGILSMLAREPRDVMPLIETAITRFAENLQSQTAAKEKLETELRIARDIQLSSLPSKFPAFPDRAEIDVFASMEPAEQVGGDFYDFFFIDGNRLFLAVGDVSGKGVPASLFMMTAKTLLKTEALRGTAPAQILHLANQRLVSENDSFLFVTVFCAVLDLRTGQMEFANAGHTPPLRRARDGHFEYLDLDPGTVLGMLEDGVFSSGRLTVDRGGVFVLYTDGVTDAMNREEEFFSEPRLKDTVDRLDSADMEGLVGGLRQEIHAFAKGTAQFDDITILAVKFNG